MEPNWAADNLQVIRTLMERTALYRRALAPVMLLAGTIGVVGAAGGLAWHLDTLRAFVGYWLAVSLVPGLGAFLIVRRQALRAGEPLWSPPAGRVVRAVAPALVAGLGLGLAAMCRPVVSVTTTLPALWALCYGAALHAAGFFTPRGLGWFGWLLLLAGLGLLFWRVPDREQWRMAHLAMGAVFGILHLLYGAYLFATEARKHAA
ncbi:MAG: hypothetical protein ABSC03_10175 [Verrucomicrobiota bacterium]|jgi:hypothetical protein